MYYVVESDEHFLAGAGIGWTYWTHDEERAHRFRHKAEAMLAAEVVGGTVFPRTDGKVKESE